MKYIDFLNLYKEKNKFLMWLFGAGTSVSAGAPTATNLILQFKINIFCKLTGESPKIFKDLSNTTTRKILEEYFIKNNIVPKNNENDYSFYFELAYPDSDIRRKIIEDVVKDIKPSYGHKIIATMMKMNLCRCVWTTNFDKLIEDAVAELNCSTTNLVVSSLENPSLARTAINSEKWPLLVKMHGDFQSEKLKNIKEELANQDKDLRLLLLEQCKRYGLIVIGYSGRDNSIMDVLEEALDNGNGFPHGLYWLLKIGENPSNRLKTLMKKANDLKIKATIIEIQNFDETMFDLLKQIDNISNDIKKYLNNEIPKVSFPPLLPQGNGFPVIRLNALPILNIPLKTYLIDCEIGGNKEIIEVINKFNSNIAAIRRKFGVIAYGDKKEIEKTFKNFNIKSIKEIILKKEMFVDGHQELNLLYQLIIKCFENNLPVIGKYRNHNYYLIIDKSKLKSQIFAEWNMFGQQFKEYCYGKISNSSIEWIQAIKIKIEYRYNKFWLLTEPKIWIETETKEESQINQFKKFLNKKYTYRYNIPSNIILDKWIELLIGKNKNKTLVLNKEIKDSPKFIINGTTAYSGRITNDV